jgi:acyl-CoA hydrolase
MHAKTCNESRSIQTNLVMPTELNNHKTLFGGALMSHIDAVAAISAFRHCRNLSVTASTDSVDFLYPIRHSDSVCLESYVTWTGRCSMEVFVKVITEDLLSGQRKVAATSFLTFVAVDGDGRPLPVPPIIPVSEEEVKMHETAPVRAAIRKQRREESKHFADYLTTTYAYE